MRFISARYRFLVPALAAVFLLAIHPSSAFSQAGGPVTKGFFIERFFLNKFSRSPSARAYIPTMASYLSPAERYAAVVRRLNEKGVILLTGSKPGDLLTRVEHISLTYLLAGGVPGKNFAEMKGFLKDRGAIDASDIGFIKSFQGDATVTRKGTENPLKISGAEPVRFLDLDETDFDARLELQFDDGSTITIGEDTSLTIDEMVFDPKTNLRKISLRLAVGTLRVSAAKNTNPNSSLNVVTPTSVAGVRGTDFNVLVAENGATRIITFEGAVSVRAVLPSESRPQSREEAGPGAKPGLVAGTPTVPAEESAEESAEEPAESRPESREEARPGAKPGVIADTPKEVIVKAGQTMTMEPGTTAVGLVKTATESQIREVKAATRITRPATVASVSAAETSQTDTIVQVNIMKSKTNTVQSAEKTAKLTKNEPIKDEKGVAINEVADNETLTTPTSPTREAGRLTGLSGVALKRSYLALSATKKATRFGTLTFAQQKDLLSQLTRTQTRNLLVALKLTPPFTAVRILKVLDSQLDFGAAITPTQAGRVMDNMTASQAVAQINCNDLHRRCIFESGSVTGDIFSGGAETVFTASGKVFADALTLELDRIAKAGGTLSVPNTPSVQLQMLLPTASKDFLYSTDPTHDFGAGAGGDVSLHDFFVGKEIPFIFDKQIPRTVNIANQIVQDAFNGRLRPAVYNKNGGFQAGQLRRATEGVIGDSNPLRINTATRQSALNNNGFLAYAVQVEEDIVNSAALAVSTLTSAGANHAEGELDNLVNTQLALSTIRARDALIAQNTDARAGLVTFASNGSRVRVQQYVYRPPGVTDELRMTSISLFDLDTDQGLSYTDLRVVFKSGELTGKSAIQIRNLPWNEYFSVFYTGGHPDATDCSNIPCEPAIGSPLGSPEVESLIMEMGNDGKDFIREAWTGFAAPHSGGIAKNFQGDSHPEGRQYRHQHPKKITLVVKGTSTTSKTFTVGNGLTNVSFDPRAGADEAACGAADLTCTASIPSGQFRVIPDIFGVYSPNVVAPKGFHYVVNDAGTNRNYPIGFRVLGDSTSSADAGVQLDTCGPGGSETCSALRFNTIWDAFRINMNNNLNNPNSLPTINIGSNVLQVRAAKFGDGEQVLNQPIINVLIPWPRMIWRGEANF